MSKTQFVDGLIVKAPHANAPDFIKCKLAIKRDELIAWLQGQDEWVNLDVKSSKGGKWYASVDNWKPNQNESQEVKSQEPVVQYASSSDAINYPDDDIDPSEIPF